jgi:hypothetical protein
VFLGPWVLLAQQKIWPPCLKWFTTADGTLKEWQWQRKTEGFGEKHVTEPLFSPKIPHGLTCAQIQASEVRSRRLTTWAIGRITVFYLVSSGILEEKTTGGLEGLEESGIGPICKPVPVLEERHWDKKHEETSHDRWCLVQNLSRVGPPHGHTRYSSTNVHGDTQWVRYMLCIHYTPGRFFGVSYKICRINNFFQ